MNAHTSATDTLAPTLQVAERLKALDQKTLNISDNLRTPSATLLKTDVSAQYAKVVYRILF